MNRKFCSIALMSAVLALGSCNSESDGPEASPSKYITVSTEIGALSRVATADNGSETFTEGDEISVYAWTGDATAAPATTDRVVDNSINKLTGGTWVANPQMLWKSTTDKHYFIGIYPKTAEAVDDLTAGEYTFDVANQEASDLLVAVNPDGLLSKDNPVKLTFDHVMAKLIVNLSYRNQWGGTPTVESVKVCNSAASATVNYLTKAVTASDDGRADISLPATKANEQYTSVLIPQGGVSKIVITIGGKEYVYQHGGDIKLESGKYTTVNLIVGRDEITLDGISINGWQTGEEINGGEALD